jgi:hypothetical protein
MVGSAANRVGDQDDQENDRRDPRRQATAIYQDDKTIASGSCQSRSRIKRSSDQSFGVASRIVAHSENQGQGPIPDQHPQRTGLSLSHR